MILVAGEALVDVLAGADGALTALPGGAPFNVARAVAWLGGDCAFLGRLSDDGFGARLREALAQAGVELAVPAPTRAPTPLAVAELDASGSAQYRFYHDNTAATRLLAETVPARLLEAAEVLVVGGVVLTVEPARSTLLGLVAGAPPALTIVCDPNCRPRAIHDPAAYRDTVAQLLRRVDIVKVSVEDLEQLCGDDPPMVAARALLAQGPAAVLVTDGPAPVRIVTAAGEWSVPVPPVEVVDTIGAGDAFVAGFVAWWSERGMARSVADDPEVLRAAAESAVQVAARACQVSGAGLAPVPTPDLAAFQTGPLTTNDD